MTAFPVGVELQIDGTWTDVSQRARRFPPTIRRGREDEASNVQPTTAQVVFDNNDGALTPRNPTSLWYPHIKRGLPARLSVEAGNPFLELPGAVGDRASTPDNAALDITGDLFMAVEVLGPVALPSAAQIRYELTGKWITSTANRSYYLNIDPFGRLVLFWSTDGTVVPTAAVSQYEVPQRTAGPITVSVTFTVNFGGLHIAGFHGVHGSLDDLLAALNVDEVAARLGTPYIAAGATSIFASTAPLEIGDITGAGDAPYPGIIRRAQVRSGDHTGTIVANADFTAQTPGATGFTDSAGRVWSVAGDAAITNRQHRFVGTVDAINLGWPKPRQRDDTDIGVARATFTVAGDLRRMQQGSKPFNSTLHRHISSPSRASFVHAYWPFEDGDDARAIASPTMGVRAGATVGMNLSSDDSLDASGSLPSVPGGSLFRWRFDVPSTIPLNTNWQSTMFVRIPEAPVSPAELQMMVVDASSTQVRTWAIQINDTIVRLRGLDHTGTEVINDTLPSDPLMFGTWMLVALNITQDGGNIDWDYDMILIPDGFGFGDSGTIAGSCGRPTRLRAGSTSPAGDGFSCGHFIVTTNVVTGWLAGADTAWVGETAAHRVWRLCREEQIPVVIVGDNTSVQFFRGNPELSEQMGPQGTGTLPELLQECADTDLGVLYEQRGVSGLAFRTHKSLQNQTAAMTLDLEQRGLAEPFEPVLDDQRLRNDITAKRDQGSSARVVDETSVDEEGLYDVDVTVNVASDLRLPNQAGWRLHLGTWPELRLPAIASSMLAAGSPVIGDWLDVDLGDRFTAANLMRQYDRDTDLLLEGYDETLSFFGWDTALNGSPAGPWEVGVRNDANLGKRDTAGSVILSSVTTTGTSLSVETSLGPVWSAVDSDDGFDIAVGGERMTVTDISGTSSPQTFTVTRSVNGVVKSHTAGAAVRLWRPTVRAL